jgi:hypothetical protein
MCEALVITKEKRQLLQQVASTQLGQPASSQPAPRLKLASGTKEIPPKVDKRPEAHCLRDFPFLEVGKRA